MKEAQLLERLQRLPTIQDMPLSELAWLAEHGELEIHEPGSIVVHGGRPVERMLVILSGSIAVRVDRGSGPRLVMGWGTGEVTGMLPYSRMTAPPGHNVAEEPSELLAVAVGHLPEMVSRCPTFTTYTVHLMLDRARSFRASDLQDEKMASLGRLAAGLAHELNNPASAAARSAKLLIEAMAQTEEASHALGGAGLSDEQRRTIATARNACRARPGGTALSPLAQAEREDRFLDWLRDHGQAERHAIGLAETAIELEHLDTLASALPAEALDSVLQWLAAGSSAWALAADIENAASRIHELVGAVKRFTYMDTPSGDTLVPVEPGIRDTVQMVASKARAKGVSVELDIEPDLPAVPAAGGELNQVWLNLIDNALDAVAEGGEVQIRARRVLDRVEVSVIDDGPGIPDDVMPRIFDPFFSTKPPGQGTGLGLELTRSIVHKHRGDVVAESEPGRTEFRVSLVISGDGMD